MKWMKHYPPEFKADAVALYRSRPGATIKSVATDLGVNTETLRNWIRAADGRRPGSHAAARAPTRPPGPPRRHRLGIRRRPSSPPHARGSASWRRNATSCARRPGISPRRRGRLRPIKRRSAGRTWAMSHIRCLDALGVAVPGGGIADCVPGGLGGSGVAGVLWRSCSSAPHGVRRGTARGWADRGGHRRIGAGAAVPSCGAQGSVDR